MKTNIKRIDTLIALYNKSIETATHTRLMYLWNLLTVYVLEESTSLNWGIIVVPSRKLQVFEVTI